MKKIILFVVMLVAFVVTSQAQEVVRATKTQPIGSSYYTYPTVPSDSVGTAQDSVLFPILVSAAMPYKFDIAVTCEKKSGSDTSIHICAYGKKFLNDTWERIGTSGARSANVTSTNIFVKYSYGTAVQYRYIRIHVQKPTNKVGSTGVKLTGVEFKYWEQ